jgi:MFS family permease
MRSNGYGRAGGGSRYSPSSFQINPLECAMQHDGVAAPRGLWKIILASSAGTLIEWYDFFVFGSLATIIAGQFFPKGNDTAALLSTLATFATGFLVRPFGAAFFGKMGDVLGRKHTFLLTLLMMGGATVAIGLVPNYATIGAFAPALLVLFRLIQGLALGGEYGGATTYVAEHAPANRQGFYTSFIQITSTLGLFVSLIVVLVTRTALTEPVFASWGWRIPFLLSAVLILFSYLVRRRLDESPMFAELKKAGKLSKNPLVESFTNRENRVKVLIALFGATAGQAVVFYTSQFYTLVFLTTICHIQGAAANKIEATGLILGAPFYVIFGAFSDRIGRKKLIMAGCFLAAVFYLPVFGTMKSVSTPQSPSDALNVRVVTERRIDPETKKMTAYEITRYQDNSGAEVVIERPMSSAPGVPVDPSKKVKREIIPGPKMFFLLVDLVWLLVIFATMAYAPIAAFLVGLFPVRIRYTSLSVPYHIGNGIFGGLMPVIATAIVDKTKNDLAGLYYPIAVALMTVVIGSLFIKEKRNAEGFEEEPDLAAGSPSV